MLQRGDLSEALLPAAIETLGSEDAKEKFYTQFERTEDLLEFYAERKQYNKYFELALSEGKFEDALHMAMESRAVDPHGSTSAIPKGDLLTLFNGLMAGNTWSSIQFNLHEASTLQVLPTLKQPNQAITAFGENIAPELRGPSTGWEQILDCLQNTDNRHLQIPRKCYNIYHADFQGLGNDFLDLVVSFTDFRFL